MRCPGNAGRIDQEGRIAFLAAGGKAFHYIPCLNDGDAWITALCNITVQHLVGCPTQRLPDVAAQAASKSAALALGAKQ